MTTIPPISCTIQDAHAVTGISVRRLHDLLNAKTIESHYEGTRRLVDYDSLRAYIKSLPNDRVAS